MDRGALCWVWTVFGPVQVALTYAAMERSQGWPDVSPFDAFHRSEPANAYFAILCTGTLATLLCWTARQHARKTDSGVWSARLPVAALIGQDPTTPEMRLFQGVSAFIFVLAPIVAVVHFWRELLDRGALRDATGRSRPLLEDFFALSAESPAFLFEGGNEKGISWLMGLSGAAPCLITAILLYQAVSMVVTVFFPPADR